ncbi:hypothetical protein BpHYR1_008358, partial [Brachionus plicatilis]
MVDVLTLYSFARIEVAIFCSQCFFIISTFVSNSFELYAKGIIENSSNFSQLRQKVGDSKEKLIVLCMYSRKACNMSWFRYYYHAVY